eukprot:m.672958 g.672958  ORF g.672958 m.672958 type:complete len:522 (-) comp22777_c0_seq14:770-2335(-)
MAAAFDCGKRHPGAKRSQIDQEGRSNAFEKRGHKERRGTADAVSGENQQSHQGLRYLRGHHQAGCVGIRPSRTDHGRCTVHDSSFPLRPWLSCLASHCDANTHSQFFLVNPILLRAQSLYSSSGAMSSVPDSWLVSLTQCFCRHITRCVFLAQEHFFKHLTSPRMTHYVEVSAACAESGHIQDAIHWLEQLVVHQPDLVNWSSLLPRHYEEFIGWYAATGNSAAVTRWFELLLKTSSHRDMTKEFLQLKTYNTVIDAYSQQSGGDGGAFRAFAVMRDRGVTPNAHTLNGLTANQTLSQRPYHQQILQCFEAVLASGLEPDALQCVTAINAYAASSNRRSVIDLFEVLDDLDAIPENLSAAAVNMCVQSGDSIAASKWFKYLVKKDLNIEKKSYEAALKAYAQGADNVAATECFDRMVASGIKPTAVTYSVLINAHAQSGDSVAASEQFACMIRAGIAPSVVTYNTLINAHAQSGDSKTAMAVFEQMLDAGLTPDRCPVVVVVHRTCAHGIIECIDAELHAR